MTASGRSALGRDLILSAGGKFIAQGASALGGVLVAHLLGPTLRGDYALVLLAAGVAGTAGTFGYEYWVTAATARDAPAAVVRSVISLQTRRAATVLFLGGVLAGLGLQAWHPRLTFWVGTAAGAFAAANVASMLRLAVVTGQRRMGEVALAQIAAAVTYVVLVAALLLIDERSVALVTASVAVCTAVLAGAARTRFRGRRSGASREHRRDAWRVGAPAMVGEVATLLAYRLDLAAVGIVMTTADVGRYAVAASLAELLWIIPNAATQVLLPQVAKHEGGDATAPTVVLTSAIGVIGALVIVFSAPYVVPAVFGDGFKAATDALPWLCAAAVVLGAWKLVLADLSARGLTRVRATTALAGAAVMIAADLLLVPAWGIGGAGLGSLLGYGVAFVLATRAWSQQSGHSPREFLDVSGAWTTFRSALSRLGRGSGALTPNAGADDLTGDGDQLPSEPGPRLW